MFVIEYAFLGDAEDVGSSEAKLTIAVCDVLFGTGDVELMIIPSGMFASGPGLLISAPNADYFLPDIPEDKLDAMHTFGLTIKDLSTKLEECCGPFELMIDRSDCLPGSSFVASLKH